MSLAEIAQLVEHNLAKVGVASSSLVFRSHFEIERRWKGPSGGIGRRARFRCVCREACRFESCFGHFSLSVKERICGNSSVGRAQPCQGWGREFESRFPLHLRNYQFPKQTKTSPLESNLRGIFFLHTLLFTKPYNTKKREAAEPTTSLLRDPAGTQTQDLQNRNLTLYSLSYGAESGCKSIKKVVTLLINILFFVPIPPFYI